jgi:OmpA-OmpF porin, OOP family
MKFNLKRFLSIACLSLGLVTAMTGFSYASSDTDAVVNDYGSIVGDSNGNCVRTMWQNDKDPCVVKHDIIAKIMRMDERIAYFAFNKYDLTKAEKEKLAVIAAVLKQYNIRTVKIVGYTDRIGGDEYNNKLSEKRANEVKEHLNSLVKLKSSIVEIKGLGKANQIKDCNEITERKELIKCLGANRRVEVEVDYYDFTRETKEEDYNTHDHQDDVE